jgi:phosphoribosylformimino-5-aminoimidazole carboxamide ribotide isomerase
MIEIIPSITVLSGKTVRLQQGDFSKPVHYDKNPLDLAKEFEQSGIRKIHLIDLDGAQAGKVKNYNVLRMIHKHTRLHIDFGGGISTDGDLTQAFENGANRVTVGSMALRNPALFTGWLISYGRHKLTLSADFKDDKVVYRGWQKLSEVSIYDHIEHYYKRTVLYVKSADVSKEGVMGGPSIQVYKNLMEKFPQLKLLASGGIRSAQDLHDLQEIGVYGAVVGRAFYEGELSLADMKSFMY